MSTVTAFFNPLFLKLVMEPNRAVLAVVGFPDPGVGAGGGTGALSEDLITCNSLMMIGRKMAMSLCMRSPKPCWLITTLYLLSLRMAPMISDCIAATTRSTRTDSGKDWSSEAENS